MRLRLNRKKLLRARELLGYGIEKVAEEAGISKNSVLRAEHEEDIRPVTARKIAAALGVSVADLIGESETLKAQPLLPKFPEERRADRRVAVEDARLSRERDRVRMVELLTAWHASKERRENDAARRGYLDGIVKLLNEAYQAETALLHNFLQGMSQEARRAIDEAEGWVPNSDWEEVREADRFYFELINMVRKAGFRVEESASGPPKVEKAA
jgi:transcriptional regulator with XRE-family HTH domain